MHSRGMGNPKKFAPSTALALTKSAILKPRAHFYKTPGHFHVLSPQWQISN
jgi:hypothetical protein